MRKYIKCIRDTLIVLLSILAANIAGIQVYAAEDVNITASQGKGEPGDTVDITISMKNNPGTTMYEMYISYDSDNLEVVSVEDCGNYPEWLEPAPSNYPLYISAGDALSLDDLTGNYDLAVIHFKIKDNATAGDYYFTIQKGLFLSGQLDQFQVTYDNAGMITVESDGSNAGNSNETSGSSTGDDGATSGSGAADSDTADNQSVNGQNSDENQDGTNSEQNDSDSNSTELSNEAENTENETASEIETSKQDGDNQESDSTGSKKNTNLSVKIVIVLVVVFIIGLVVWKIKKKKENKKVV